MPKSDPLARALAALKDLAQRPITEESLRELRQALSNRSPHLVAKAASIAGELDLASLTPDLEAAFDRMMVNPLASDKGCGGKAAIAEALYRLGAPSDGVFIRGIRHVQREPVFGGAADTAVPLRAHCAMGLARMGHPDLLLELADLLADSEPPARAAAARAIGYGGRGDGIPLLRYKALTGDADPGVVGECFASLLQLAPASSLAFVAGFLRSGHATVAEAAALALGQARPEGGFPVLRDWYRGVNDADLRRSGALAIALSRQDAATAFLLDEARRARPAAAADALRALAIYAHDPSLRARVLDAAAGRDDDEVRSVLHESFGAA